MSQQFILGSEEALEALAPSECERLLGDKTPRPVPVICCVGVKNTLQKLNTVTG
jgi:hypothetical protein